MPFPTAIARRHLESLAARHDVHLVWIAGYLRGESFPDPRIAAVPIPNAGIRYLVALHELGHVIDRQARYWYEKWDSGGGTDTYAEAVCEGFAWAWAAKVADRSLPVTPTDWGKAGVLLSTYWSPHEAEDTEPVLSGERSDSPATLL